MRKTIITLTLTLCGLGVGAALPAAAFAATPPSKYTTDQTTGRTWRTDYFVARKGDPNTWCKGQGYDAGFLSGNGYWACTTEVTTN